MNQFIRLLSSIFNEYHRLLAFAHSIFIEDGGTTSILDAWTRIGRGMEGDMAAMHGCCRKTNSTCVLCSEQAIYLNGHHSAVPVVIAIRWSSVVFVPNFLDKLVAFSLGMKNIMQCVTDVFFFPWPVEFFLVRSMLFYFELVFPSSTYTP